MQVRRNECAKHYKVSQNGFRIESIESKAFEEIAAGASEKKIMIYIIIEI